MLQGLSNSRVISSEPCPNLNMLTQQPLLEQTWRQHFLKLGICALLTFDSPPLSELFNHLLTGAMGYRVYRKILSAQAWSLTYRSMGLKQVESMASTNEQRIEKPYIEPKEEGKQVGTDSRDWRAGTGESSVEKRDDITAGTKPPKTDWWSLLLKKKKKTERSRLRPTLFDPSCSFFGMSGKRGE